MFLKNKTWFLLIAGFVFLFLVSRLYFGLDQKITAKEAAGADSSQAKSIFSTSTIIEEEIKTEKFSQQNLIATGSPEPAALTHPVRAARPPLSIEGISTFPAKEDFKEEYFKVAKVVDGDTIDIIMNGRTERLRLIGINTPETVDPRKAVECFGREASAQAKKFLEGQEVKIAADETQADRDKYGRLLRYVWRSDGLFYNLEIIKEGYAYEYTYDFPYQYQKEFKEAENYARENKLGLWADGACGQKNIDSGEPDKASAAPAVAPAKGDCLIKGNISSTKEKIYHLPGCASYEKTVINESQEEKWFCAEADALAAGWRKAKNCP